MFTLEQQKANRRLWVEALRSGKYEQGRHRLRDNENGFCCLGVACDVFGPDDWDGLKFLGEVSYLPPAVMEFFGISDRRAFYRHDLMKTTLADQNDKGKSFAEIADIIESEPLGLFVESIAP